MAENLLSRLARNPYATIDSASITRVDELGNGYDDWGSLIAPKFEQPQQTWGETALGVATAPARLATALAGSLSPYGADGWQVPPIINEGADALTAVGDAYTGKMAPEDINSRALGMAGFMMAGGGPAITLERSLAQRGINSAADMIPTAIKDYGQAAYRSLRYPGESPVMGTVDQFELGTGLKQGGDLQNLGYAVGRDGTIEMLYPDGFDTYGAFSGPNRLANDRGAIGDVHAYRKKPRPEFDVADGATKVSDDARYNDLVRRSFERFGKHYESLNPEQTRVIRDGVTNRASFDVIDGGLYSNSDSRPGIMAGAIAGQERPGITAYHGSPHDFDKFDLSKIGTGEGAQAYGHGLYFAENEGVARSYRNALSPSVLSTADGAAQTIAAKPSALSTSQAERVASATPRVHRTRPFPNPHTLRRPSGPATYQNGQSSVLSLAERAK